LIAVTNHILPSNLRLETLEVEVDLKILQKTTEPHLPHKGVVRFQGSETSPAVQHTHPR
jgi:hypothetical protein